MTARKTASVQTRQFPRVAMILLVQLSWIPADRIHAQTYERAATYVSEVDEKLTIRRIAVLPISDNVDGIYARPLESQLVQLVQNSHRWDYVEAHIADSPPTLSELEENPATLQSVVRGIDADAFVAGLISRGPTGLSIRLDLFMKNDGKVLVQETLVGHDKFELPSLQAELARLYKTLIRKLPYDGTILSRQQNRVTINLGKSDGLEKNHEVTVVQIISVNRHPKFNFLINTEKEVLGRVKILKVDETLSFGTIVAEKEKGAIGRFAKISGLNPVQYAQPDAIAGRGEEDLANRPDSGTVFSTDPKEWLPIRPPSFGQVGIRFGIGSYTNSMNLQETGSIEAESAFYPSLGIHGELWLNANWIVRAELLQAVISTSNPLPNSSPEELNHNLSRYSLAMGYNFLFQNDFFGPKLSLSAGFASIRVFVDDSQPQGLTTTNYSGAVIGLSGSLPVTKERDWYVGGNLNLFLMPKLSESPVTSGGDSESTISDFSFYVERKIAENLRATGSLEFSLYSTNFTGTGTREQAATSLSQKSRLITTGVTYLF